MEKDTLATLTALLPGLAGFTLQKYLYSFFLNDAQLLPESRIPVMLLVLTLGSVAAFALAVYGRGVRTVAVPKKATAAGQALFGIALLASALLLPEGSLSGLQPLILPAGTLAGAAMFYSAVKSFRGEETPFLPYVAATVYLGIYMLARYRMWSARPQIMDFAFDMLACVAITLMVYHRGDSLCNVGRQKNVFFFSLCTLMLCTTALGHGEAPWLYWGGIALALTSRERL